jgi:hypothetical protein
VERVLGEVPEVEKVYWDWRKQAGYVRFKRGLVAKKEVLAEAITKGTMYSSGEVEYLRSLAELPDELR